MKAMHAMTRDVVCIHANDTLSVAAEIMNDMAIRHLPVVDDNELLIGMISDRDVLLYSTVDDNGNRTVLECAVGGVMTRSPITCNLSDSIEQIADAMLRSKIDCVPVVSSDGKLTGLLTSVDLIELIKNGKCLDASTKVPFSYKLRLRDSSGYGKYHIE